MKWINVFGLVFMLIIMIPNVIFAMNSKDGLQNLWKNKGVELIEQVGRYGCFAFMVIIIPSCGFGFSSKEAFIIYLIVDVILILTYCLIWIICFKKSSVFRALALSIIPSCIFIFSGILCHYWPLMICSVLFAPCHIVLSYKNAELATKS